MTTPGGSKAAMAAAKKILRVFPDRGQTRTEAIAQIIDAAMAKERAEAEELITLLRRYTTHEVHMNEATCQCRTCAARRAIHAYEEARR